LLAKSGHDFRIANRNEMKTTRDERLSATTPPSVDPTPIFEIYRGHYGTELLTAAIAHFNLFGRLALAPLSFDDLRQALGLEARPATVLVTALRAFGLLAQDREGRFDLSPLAREHLVPGGPYDVSDYIRLVAKSPGVQAMVERLQTNRPVGAKPTESGVAFIYRAGLESAMEKETMARTLTLALAGRAKNVAPLLSERVPLNDARLLLDVGGGTGIYSIACLQRNPRLRAIVWDRPEVLKVATEMAAAYGVADRLECRPGDMFADPVPPGVDVILFSNILHDWDVPECRKLIHRCAAALPAGGRLLIHDVFLNDALDGPLPIALYSAALFTLTEGRAYSAAEYREWLAGAGLATSEIVPTLIHCGVLTGLKQ
jgi:SAM-dependent methyltransferase